MSRTLTVLAAALLATVVGSAGAQMLAVGDPFPAFELTAHDGSTVDSADLDGQRYLLFYYPKADTAGCTKEACAFRDRWELLRSAGIKVFGISYDEPEANAAFAAKYELPFLLLSDDGELARVVGAANEGSRYSKRISYLVGADGTVTSAYAQVDVEGHADEVLEDAR